MEGSSLEGFSFEGVSDLAWVFFVFEGVLLTAFLGLSFEPAKDSLFEADFFADFGDFNGDDIGFFWEVLDFLGGICG